MILNWNYQAYGNRPRQCLGLGFLALTFSGAGVEVAAAYDAPAFTITRQNVGTLSIARKHVGTKSVERLNVGTLEVER